jgi:uncharacterized protein YjbI with pentapeptide repeats
MQTDPIFLGQWELTLFVRGETIPIRTLFVYQIGDRVVLQDARYLRYGLADFVYHQLTFDLPNGIEDAARLKVNDEGEKVGFSSEHEGKVYHVSYLFYMGGKLFLFDNPPSNAYPRFHKDIKIPGLKQIQQSKNAAGLDLSHINFSGADLSGVNLTGANLSDAKLDRAIIKGSTLTSAQMPGQDLSTVVFDDKTIITGTQQKPTNLSGAKVPYGLISRNWQWLDLTNAEIIGLPQELSSKDKPLLARGARLSGIKNNLTDSHLDYADLSEADLTGLTLEGAHLTKAKLISTLLSGANLSNSTLTEADMSGAQLGSIALVFNVTGANPVNALKTALEKGNVDEVIAIFKANGVALNKPVSIEVPERAAGRVWTVADTHAAYTVRLEEVSGQQLFGVYRPSMPAVLGGAFMKGAILTAANLYGVNASGVQLYGGAKLNNTILENVNFAMANLGNVDFTRAKLLGATLDEAVLTSAVFTGAYLTPSVNKQVSLYGANLQGAIFTDAHLDQAIFTNAAVSVASADNPNQPDGVWLFQVKAQERKPLVDELNEAANQFTLPESSLRDLVPGPVNQALRDAFEDSGSQLSDDAEVSIRKDENCWRITDGQASYRITRGCDQQTTTPALIVQSSHSTTKPFPIPLALEHDLEKGRINSDVRKAFADKGKVTLSEKATVAPEQRAIAWNIESTPTDYTVWLGLNTSCEMTLSVAPSIPNTRQWFKEAGFNLGWQTAVTRREKGKGWVVDNGSDDPFNASVGYIRFNVIASASDGPVDVYGLMMRLTRLVESDRLEYHNIVCGVTLLKDALQPTTYCSNGQQFKNNKEHYREWMRAAKPPSPPSCVPSADGSYYCPKAK